MAGFAGCYLGYDPGGDKKHGVAAIQSAGPGTDAQYLSVDTVNTVRDVIAWFRAFIESRRFGPVRGIGVDTLAYWSASSGGLRGADRALRLAFEPVKASVVHPNSLYGAMSVNGMFVLQKLLALEKPYGGDSLYVTETHPKVMFFAMTGTEKEKYVDLLRYEKETGTTRNWTQCWKNREKGQVRNVDKWPEDERRWWLDDKTARWLRPWGLLPDGCKSPEVSHEMDALVSAGAALEGRSGRWRLNLRCESDCQSLVAENDVTAAFDTGGWEEGDSLWSPSAKIEYRWPDGKWIEQFRNSVPARRSEEQK